MEFFATCPAGFERLLADELGRLRTPKVRPLKGQVAFMGKLSDAYRVCLWSHLASRVVAVLGRVGAQNADELYEGLVELPWEEHIARGTTFAVSASGGNDELRTTQFTALRTKDAISDRLLGQLGVKPATDVKNPGVSVVVRISRDHATVGIDLAGAPLFKRAYERTSNSFGLRSDYAAALLILGGWPGDGDNPTLLDLEPASGTLLAEAALMAAHRAPGLGRMRWGFEGWAQHKPVTWQRLMREAQGESVDLVSVPATLYALAGGKQRSALRATLRAAGVNAELQCLYADELAQVNEPHVLALQLSSVHSDELVREASLLNLLAQSLTTHPRNIVVAGHDLLASSFVRQEPRTVVQSMLGRDDLYLYAYDGKQSAADKSDDASANSGETAGQEQAGFLPEVVLSDDKRIPVLVEASDQFATRLQKIARHRAKWARREDVSCYRVYDADLPDYAVSIDLYQGSDPATGMLNGRRWLSLSEYAAPSEIDPTVARSRLLDVLTLSPAILEVDPRNTYLRVRRRDKGGSQYAAEATGIKEARGGKRAARGDGQNVPLPQGSHLIDEGGLTFEVNFSSRLDCGIFLDHRDTRALLREMAKETQGSKRFLNLFAYTGTATCYAADGGMRHTTTVDLSRPSLDWAQRNMERNGFTGPEHEYVQADVIRWISEQRHTPNRWDLVFCDVPTFSNSNSMGNRSFDVQRDHAELLIGVSRLLTANGTCVFSCNLRSFKPDTEKMAKAGVRIEDITEKTIPEDFERNKKIHHTYLVTRTPREEGARGSSPHGAKKPYKQGAGKPGYGKPGNGKPGGKPSGKRPGGRGYGKPGGRDGGREGRPAKGRGYGKPGGRPTGQGHGRRSSGSKRESS
ncbi:MAG: bifunctional 23S rRNA (guanine(2069)-N(7))-methyltransferase RlmK/23S rRNA (guanine(2445)-N(2))-methyltransferase RlmL [Coriobacteriales bacterium]|nr:bifunctional 23S rRNA (guanine(2069)-N(7))-methyltransferase RlmK/23S rRNA (guanine(2445)-N(2))-methyltransferase RlmL [Coriobacteriales bacterium]